MTSYFLGGAGGSLASVAAYSHFGWLGVAAVGATLSACGGAVWAFAPGR